MYEYKRFGELQVAYVYLEKMRRRGYRGGVYRYGRQIVVQLFVYRRGR